MDPHHLVTMANDIAAFFKGSETERDAVSAVARHLRLYWHPRMRRELANFVAAGGAGLDELALGAIEVLSSDSDPGKSKGRPEPGR